MMIMTIIIIIIIIITGNATAKFDKLQSLKYYRSRIQSHRTVTQHTLSSLEVFHFIIELIPLNNELQLQQNINATTTKAGSILPSKYST
jgi:hypothetical protein